MSTAPNLRPRAKEAKGSRAAGNNGLVETLDTAILPTASSPTATRVRARSRTTPYAERPTMKPMARRNNRKATIEADLASCQPHACPAHQSAIEAANTTQPSRLTTARTGQTNLSHTARILSHAGARKSPAVPAASDHTAAGWSLLVVPRLPGLPGRLPGSLPVPRRERNLSPSADAVRLNESAALFRGVLEDMWVPLFELGCGGETHGTGLMPGTGFMRWRVAAGRRRRRGRG